MSNQILDKLVDRAVAAQTAKMEEKQKRDSAQAHRTCVLRYKRQKELEKLKGDAEVVIKSVLAESDKMWHLFWNSFPGRIVHTSVVLGWEFDCCGGIVVAVVRMEPEEAIVMHFPELESSGTAAIPSGKRAVSWFREKILDFKLVICRRETSQPYGVHWQETDNPHRNTVAALKRLTKPASTIKSMIDCVTK